MSAAVANYQGSDTLASFTKTLVTQCQAVGYKVSEFNYIGGGSGTAGQGMQAGTQDIGPQSRKISQSEACTSSIAANASQGESAVTLPVVSGQAPPQAEQWALGRDGLSVFTSKDNAGRCIAQLTPAKPTSASYGSISQANDCPGGCATESQVNADFDDFGASLAFKSAVIGCGTWTPAIAPVPANLRWDLGGYADDDPVTGVNPFPSPPSLTPGSFNVSVLALSPTHAVGVAGSPTPPQWLATGASTDPVIPLGGALTKTFTAGSCAYPAGYTPNTAAGEDASHYAFTDWKDVLRVLWAGGDHARFPGSGNGQTRANRIDRCNSPIRHGLVSNWDNIVQHLPGVTCAGGPAGASCGKLRHVLRRDDVSGTTDTFLNLLGLATMSGNLAIPSTAAGVYPRTDGMGRTGYSEGLNVPFCNGRDGEDQDPIRVQCTNNAVSSTSFNDETCNVDGTMGLVTAIRIPTTVGTTNININTAGNSRDARQVDLYTTVECSPGEFEVLRPPAVYNATQTCPDKSPFIFTGCRTPVNVTSPGVISTSHGNCITPWTTRAVTAVDEMPNAFIGGLQNDGRLWNRILRGDRVTESGFSHFGNPTNNSPVLRDERGDEVTFLDARMRSRTTAGGVALADPTKICREEDATKDLGCLAQASDCTVAYAGREAIVKTATFVNAATGLLAGPVKDATDTTACPSGSADPGCFAQGPTHDDVILGNYPLARKLYYNTIVGLASILDPSSAGADHTITPRCIADGTCASQSPINGTATNSRFPTVADLGPEQAELMKCLLESPAGGPLDFSLNATGFFPISLTSCGTGEGSDHLHMPMTYTGGSARPLSVG